MRLLEVVVAITPASSDEFPQDVEVDVLELVEVEAALAELVLAELLEQVGVGAVQREPVEHS